MAYLARGRSVSSGGGGSSRCKREECPCDSRGIAEGPDFVGVQRNWIVQLVSVACRCCASYGAPRQRDDEKPAHRTHQGHLQRSGTIAALPACHTLPERSDDLLRFQYKQ